MHQADRSIAQIMRLPGTIGNSLFAEERLGDNAIAAASTMRIERMDRGAQSFAPLFRYFVKCRTWRASIHRAP